MPESSASERPSIEPAQTDMKEVPSTADMRILAEMHGNKPQGVDFGSDKPNFTFQIGQEPKASATGSQHETSLETINIPSSTPRRTEESRTHAADPLDALSSDHFSRVADEAIRTSRTGELGNEISLDDIIRQTAAQDEVQADAVRGFLGREAQRHGARVHQRTNRESNRTSASRPPQVELVDNLATPDGDLPPLPFAGNIEGDQIGQSLVEERKPLPDTSDQEAGFRFGMPPLPRESNEQGQDNEETPEARATMNRVKRLAELPFVKTWIDRVKGYVARQSESNLAASQEKTADMKSKGLKIDPRLGVALIGLAGIYAVLIGRAGHGTGTVAEPLPSKQYGPVELVYDRPQMTSALPAEERANAIDSSQNRVFELKEKSPEKSPEGFKGKGPATIEEDFSSAGEKQSIKGIVEDQLAQLLNPEYKSKVAEMRAQGKAIDASEGWSSGTLEDFKTKLTDQLGEQKAQETYDELIDGLVANERNTIQDYNRGKAAVAADNDTVLFIDGNKKLTVLDMSREGKSAIARAVKGGYSIPGDKNFTDQYISNFKPGGDNGR